ncbi:hypothetical protein YC2023_107707 [Brassica napus]|uniref:(rape) hypothetical protein n=1 Tax=Brassica napus TaxID=3708 RepID=A0A816P289_BRANA|nr:unnamed protein product [Brassica napus]
MGCGCQDVQLRNKKKKGKFKREIVFAFSEKPMASIPNLRNGGGILKFKTNSFLKNQIGSDSPTNKKRESEIPRPIRSTKFSKTQGIRVMHRVQAPCRQAYK